MIKLVVSVYGSDSNGVMYSVGVIRFVRVNELPEVNEKGDLIVVCLDSGIGYSILDYREV